MNCSWYKIHNIQKHYYMLLQYFVIRAPENESVNISKFEL